MNRKSQIMAVLVSMASFAMSQTLDLSDYVKGARKDTIKNSENLVTNVDVAGMSGAITGYVGTALWSKVTRTHDSIQPAKYFTEIVNGTGTVYEITGPFTNLMVTLSSDFLELDTNTRPTWTNNVFPFTDGNWLGFESSGSLYITHSGGAVWDYPSTVIPAGLSAVNLAAGSASVTVSNTYYTTNAVRHFATEVELQEAKAACGLAMTNLVAAATNALMPYADVGGYGDFTTTNETGYAAIVSTNPASQTSVRVVPSNVAGTNTVSFSWPISGQRVLSAASVAYVTLGGGTTYAAAKLDLCTSDGSVLASDTVTATDAGSSSLPYFTNTIQNTVFPTNGFLRLHITLGKSAAFGSHSVQTGGATPLVLTVTRSPTRYATVGELNAYVKNSGGTATNLTIVGGNVSGDTLIGAQAITNAIFSQVPGIVYSNSVSALTIYTNASGAATSWWQVASGVTNSGVFFNGTPGVITNNQLVASIGSLNVIPATGKGVITIDSDGGGNGYSLTFSENRVYVGSGYNDGQHGLQLQPFGGHVGIGSVFAREALDVVGNIVASGTSTAAVVVSKGPIFFGPVINGKQMFLDGDATNAWIVNVNSVTNAL